MRHIIAAALALACTPAIAQECLTYQQVVASIEGDGSKVVGAASYDGSVTTEMLIVQTPDVILLMGFDAKGCYTGQQLVEPAKPKGQGV